MAGLLALLMIIGTVQLHHADVSMAGMPHDGTMSPIVMAICVGMLTAVGAAVLAIALGVVPLGRWPRSRRSRSLSTVCDPVPVWARARAGPPPLLLLCVSRR